ncbi:MAG TPA: DUF916 domain-containing protein [Chloroflexota bacterium]|nr:DUF916 domain-containing protein [Chloroflexota bacterium]
MRLARWLRWLVCVATAAGGVMGPVAPALWAAPAQQATQEGAQVSLRPVDEAGSPLPGPGYFTVTAQPGETVTLHVLVSNAGSAPATVVLQPVDASSSTGGGVAYNLPEQPVRGVGAWVELPQTSLMLEPGRATLVPFQVRVPAGTGTGEHVGGLTAFVPTEGGGSAVAGSQPGQQFSVRVQTRTVVAVVVNVPGVRETRLAVSGVEVERRPDAAYLVIRVRNTGNTLAKGQGTVLVNRAGDTTPLISGPIALETTVPGTETTFPIQWTRDLPAGRYQARVELSWDGGGTTWEDAVTVAPLAAATARPGAGPIFVATPDPRAAGAAGAERVSGIPGILGTAGIPATTLMTVLLVAMAGLLVAALAVIVALLRRPRAAGP